MNKNGQKSMVNPLYRYSILAAVIIQLGSLPVIGWNPLFAYGLALGTCISIVNYNLLVLSSKFALSMGRGLSFAVVGYIVRMAIYGGAFLFSYKTGTVSGIATLFGYMTVKLGMFYLYGFKPGFASRKYEGIKLKDIDQDQWAAEKAAKAAKPGRFEKVFKVFRSQDSDTYNKD
ncbi:MAG: ATP synthase subunit I [Anaerovoracaceae bacterium]|jgi:hypothetical protein